MRHARLARVNKFNNEGADQTVPMQGCFAPLLITSNTEHRVFSHVGSFSLHATQILVLEALNDYKLKNVQTVEYKMMIGPEKETLGE